MIYPSILEKNILVMFIYVGMELVPYLRSIHGAEAVVNSDIKMPDKGEQKSGPFVYCDVLNYDRYDRPYMIIIVLCDVESY
jgi:hypothetical protein